MSTTSDDAREYVKAGFVLVPFEGGSKGPRTKGWNLLENCIRTVERAGTLHGNIGLAHAYSGTCCIDIDDMTKAIPWFEARGVDLDALWNAQGVVRLTSGRPKRGKLIYRRPEGTPPLPSRAFNSEGVELRCATFKGLTVQDVLPPSIHPVTGEPYRWLDPGDWRNLPELPADVLQLWLSLLAPKPANRPTDRLNIGREDIEALLSKIPVAELSYDEWLHVGMAVHHETGGARVGLELWDNWSHDEGKNPKYDPNLDMMSKWESFHLDHPNPRTIGTIVRMVADRTDMSLEWEMIGEEAPTAEPRFRIETSTEFAAREYEDDYIDGVLPNAEFGVVMGQSQSGKTFVILDLVFAMVRGIPWRDRDTMPARVLYVAAEGSTGVRKRLKAYAKFHGLRLADIVVEWLADAPDLRKDVDLRDLIKDVKARGAFTHIVLDTVSQVTPGADENSSVDMGLALKNVRLLNRATGASIIFIAHVGKDASKGMRGWSGFKAAMDYELEVSRSGTKRTLKVTKSRDGADDLSFEFHLEPVWVGTTKRGKPVTSCVVIHDDPAIAPSKPARLGKREQEIMAVLGDAEDWNEVEVIAALLKKSNLRGSPREERRRHIKRALTGLAKKKLINRKQGHIRPVQPDLDLTVPPSHMGS